MVVFIDPTHLTIAIGVGVAVGNIVAVLGVEILRRWFWRL